MKVEPMTPERRTKIRKTWNCFVWTFIIFVLFASLANLSFIVLVYKGGFVFNEALRACDTPKCIEAVIKVSNNEYGFIDMVCEFIRAVF